MIKIDKGEPLAVLIGIAFLKINVINYILLDADFYYY